MPSNQAPSRASRFCEAASDAFEVIQPTVQVAATEDIDAEFEITPSKKPGRDFPAGVPTQQSILDDATKRLDVLFDKLASAMEAGARKSVLVPILEQIEEVKGQAAHAAEVLGMLTPFKPAIQDTPSAEAAPVTPLAAVATTTE